MNALHKPNSTEYAPFYSTYVDKVDTDDILGLLRTQLEDTPSFFLRLPEPLHKHRYQEDKWSIQEVLGHIIDTERVMAYRALRIGRKDTEPLPGFEQNGFVAAANFDSRSMENLVEEYKIVRQSSLLLAQHLPEEVLDFEGTASNNPITPRALICIIAGHEIHHMRIIKERYLP